MSISQVLVKFALITTLSFIPALAQTEIIYSDSGQVVGLFQQACIKYVGNRPGLRSWISAHRLPKLPSSQAAGFLGSIGSGEVFGASNVSGKHVLLSYDDGACAVMALSGDAADIQQTMLSLLRREGATVLLLPVQSKPDGSSSQALFKAEFGNRAWQISITSKPHGDRPSLAQEIILLATPD